MELVKINYKQYREDSKRFSIMTDSAIKCKCGHSLLMGNTSKRICSYCGRWVFKNKKDEFKYRLKEIKIKMEN